MHHPRVQIGRCGQRQACERGRGDTRNGNAAPAEIAVAEHNGEQWRDHEGGAARCDEGDIGEETGGKTEQPRYGSPSDFAPALASRTDEPEGANKEDAALQDVALD